MKKEGIREVKRQSRSTGIGRKDIWKVRLQGGFFSTKALERKRGGEGEISVSVILAATFGGRLE